MVGELDLGRRSAQTEGCARAGEKPGIGLRPGGVRERLLDVEGDAELAEARHFAALRRAEVRLALGDARVEPLENGAQLLVAPRLEIADVKRAVAPRALESRQAEEPRTRESGAEAECNEEEPVLHGAARRRE